MDYFLLKQSGTVSIPKAPPEKASDPMEPSVRTIGQVGILDKFDYIAREHLVSDRLKHLLALYLPCQVWRPCVFIDPPRKDLRTFWFLPALSYLPKQVETASNGMLYGWKSRILPKEHPASCMCAARKERYITLCICA